MFVLTLIYADSSTFIVGGFQSEQAANAWITIEQTKSYWKSDITWTIVDNTPTPP